MPCIPGPLLLTLLLLLLRRVPHMLELLVREELLDHDHAIVRDGLIAKVACRQEKTDGVSVLEAAVADRAVAVAPPSTL